MMKVNVTLKLSRDCIGISRFLWTTRENTIGFLYIVVFANYLVRITWNMVNNVISNYFIYFFFYFRSHIPMCAVHGVWHRTQLCV